MSTNTSPASSPPFSSARRSTLSVSRSCSTGVAAFAVELVDEYNHRGVAHAAYLHKLPGLGFDAFGNVDHYYNAERRRTFAIISHPDAGKTTLTEKLLLFGGAIHIAGAVKSNKIIF